MGPGRGVLVNHPIGATVLSCGKLNCLYPLVGKGLANTFFGPVHATLRQILNGFFEASSVFLLFSKTMNHWVSIVYKTKQKKSLKM